MFGCEKSENNLPIEGSWIEVSAKSDTIDFTYQMSGPAFWLRRGNELHNGYWLPKYGAGLYTYYLLDSDSIGLCYSFSSSCIGTVRDNYPTYYFTQIDTDTIEISNFYNPDISPSVIFTFSKIK